MNTPSIKCRCGMPFSRALIACGVLMVLAPAPCEAQLSQTRAASDQPRVKITEQQEQAAARGLSWLASQQDSSGAWSADVGFKLNETYRVTSGARGHVGVTGLAGIAFLAGGHLPGRGQYGLVVERALDFILSCVQEDGYITHGGTRMYSHAFATLFLAEIYGMTHRDDVRIKLQRAVDFIVKCQNSEGGWRYVPLARESDMSIVVCQVLALRAARNIGIRVPTRTIEKATQYVVDSAFKDNPNPQASRVYRSLNERGTFHYQRDNKSRTTFPLTAAGVTALHGLGIYSSDLIQSGIEFLNRSLSLFNSQWGARRHYFFWYGHYYAVQAMYTQGGSAWELYFTNIRSWLLKHQEPNGSWRCGAGPGSAFSTAVGVLILEIPYCLLPIFQR